MTIVEALKKLYEKLGGSSSDVANVSKNAEMVDKIADIAEGIGGLPEIGSSDNGKVLTASVDGDTKEAVWASSGGSGGASLYPCTLTNGNSATILANHKGTISVSGNGYAEDSVMLILASCNYIGVSADVASSLSLRGWELSAYDEGVTGSIHVYNNSDSQITIPADVVSITAYSPVEIITE